MDDPVPHPPPALTERTAASDAALAARLACGEPGALDPLYRRHKGSVYRFALMWSGSAAVAAVPTRHIMESQTALPARPLPPDQESDP